MRIDIISSTVSPVRIHVAQSTFKESFSEWRKMPVCKAGEFDFSDWKKETVDTEDIFKENLCRTCLRILTKDDDGNHFIVFKGDIGN